MVQIETTGKGIQYIRLNLLIATYGMVCDFISVSEAAICLNLPAIFEPPAATGLGCYKHKQKCFVKVAGKRKRKYKYLYSYHQFMQI